MAYDEKNKRIRERQELTIDSKTDVYDILVFYNEVNIGFADVAR